MVRPATIALLVALSLAACGGSDGVTRPEVSAKLKSDSEFKTLTDAQRDCLADLMVKKGDKGDLRKWVDGKKKIEDVRGDSDGLEDAASECATK